MEINVFISEHKPTGLSYNPMNQVLVLIYLILPLPKILASVNIREAGFSWMAPQQPQGDALKSTEEEE